MEIEPDSDVEEDGKVPSTTEKVLDDVELSCGCHFHWFVLSIKPHFSTILTDLDRECFIDGYTITQCQNCSKEISSLSSEGRQQVLCTVRNEGGEETNFDILPAATEEAYLRTYPEERRGHAYLQFAREGDLDAIVHLIKDDREADAEEEDNFDIMTYSGGTEELNGSGLHVAIRYGQETVAWLLLALASTLDWSKFPPGTSEFMENLGLSKEDRLEPGDIRSQTDSVGRTPKELAMELGGTWATWINKGLLDP